ncbi:MurT ligase domain-containing protein [Humibacter albus]|uniref:MurT ligase domain-containing protein n=1 Tax=Humibacter albus TaxID=427754 RepID=UPI0003B71B76|nr:MurT ligase domain-containing protein [Humibacter albus]
MRRSLAILLGRLARFATRLRGGGSAFPGYLVRKIWPRFIEDVSAQWSHGVIFVLGSNGKSTTTHMVSELLRAHGLKVFTNPTGANLPQGIASAMLSEVTVSGRLPADVAVLEVDEAFSVDLAQLLRPRTVLMLNCQVDQLYRFYETERVADMMLDASVLASENIVTNREDPLLSQVGSRLGSRSTPRVSYFGASDDVLRASKHGLLGAPDFRDETAESRPVALGEVRSFGGRDATIAVGDESITVELPARGLHYAVDAAAASATASLVLGSTFDSASVIEAFATMRPAYGRGEVIPFGDESVEFVMFKNGPSLQLNLDSLLTPPQQVMFALDEGTPDISWIYDVSFDSLDHVDVVTGEKAWQVALRLEYAGVPVGSVEPDLEKAIELMRRMPSPTEDRKLWFVNYEQMMLARKFLGFPDLETRL